MADSIRRLAALGTAIPEISLPRDDVDLQKWAVIACDQFTQDRSYWGDVKKIAGPSPSTLNLIFPEIYLEDPSREARITGIRQAMKSYLKEGVLAPPRQGCVYIERSTPHHQCRRGLVLAIDLEAYDWTPSSRTLIRSSEGTVPERLLPRMEIRRGAPLETPHILLLIDDDEDTLLPGLGERAKLRGPCYDTPLMAGAGRVSGWFLDRETDWAYLTEGLEKLCRRAEIRYAGRSPHTDSSRTPHPGAAPTQTGNSEERPFLYAVGDGNHSLATAKAVWEEYKKAHTGEPGLGEHPARWVLAEVENLYDPGIDFEPIHRLIFGAQFEEVLEILKGLPGFSSRPVDKTEELSQSIADSPVGGNRYGLISGNRRLVIETSATGIATERLQPLLDAFIRENKGLSIDYIHGEEELFRLAGAGGSRPAVGEKPVTGLLLPPVKKAGLFQTVANSGPLPRKSFSMGEAEEKRFYLECRKLFG
jgi:hypothetical protein